MRSAWWVAVLCLGCAGSRPTTEPAPVAANGPPLDAMLLPPVDGQLALWVNQPANFAVVGVAGERGADVLYQQTALDGVPKSGYVYVPQGDAGYDRVYLVASREPIDLTSSLDNAMTGAKVVDAYAADTVRLDSLRCEDGRLSLVRTRIVSENPPRTREEEQKFAECYQQQRQIEAQRRPIAAGRQFFVVAKGTTQPTHKSLPPGYKPPKLVPKPGFGSGPGLGRGDERTLRWLASKDQWHAVTHNGEPGNELPRAAVGYMARGGVSQVRAIMNGSQNSVRGTGSSGYSGHSGGYSSSSGGGGYASHGGYSAPASYSGHASSGGGSGGGSSGGGSSGGSSSGGATHHH
jgi:hypothetical protein